MTDYEILGAGPLPGKPPLPGMNLTADQVAGRAPIQPTAGTAPAKAKKPAPRVISGGEGDAEASISDARGRVLLVQPMTILMRMRLIAMLGTELANNNQYMHFCTVAASVHSIDGQRLPIVSSRQGVEGLVAQIGDDGMAAAVLGLVAIAPKRDPEEQQDADWAEAGN